MSGKLRTIAAVENSAVRAVLADVRCLAALSPSQRLLDNPVTQFQITRPRYPHWYALAREANCVDIEFANGIPLKGSNVQNRPIPLTRFPHLDESAPPHARAHCARDGRRNENLGCVDGYDFKRPNGDSSGARAGQARDAELRE